MELDDLKRNWNDQSIETNKNADIMKLIQHQSSGPVASLKKAFKRQMRIMLLLPAMIIVTNLPNAEHMFKSVLFWSYIVFCVAIVIFFYFNYRIASHMEGMEGDVKANLRRQVMILETRLKWNIIGLRLSLLFFVVLTEVLPYFQHFSMLDKWHAVPPIFRFGIYALFFLLQYTLSRRLSERKFGGHLRRLNELVREMQD